MTSTAMMRRKCDQRSALLRRWQPIFGMYAAWTHLQKEEVPCAVTRCVSRAEFAQVLAQLPGP